MSVVGGDGQSFWHLTPREVQSVFDGHAERLKREHNDRAWAVWHIAFLTVYAPEKADQFPTLSRLRIADQKPQPRTAGWEDEFARFSAWATAKGRKGP